MIRRIFAQILEIVFRGFELLINFFPASYQPVVLKKYKNIIALYPNVTQKILISFFNLRTFTYIIYTISNYRLQTPLQVICPIRQLPSFLLNPPQYPFSRRFLQKKMAKLATGFQLFFNQWAEDISLMSYKCHCLF